MYVCIEADCECANRKAIHTSLYFERSREMFQIKFAIEIFVLYIS
jgi:hypothetical protein